jgi:hypothetical protein
VELHEKIKLINLKMYPSREEFSELIFYISELKHQYNNKIDEQSIKINEQSMIIEELLWQIRELSDKIRQINQWKCETDTVISDSKRKFDEIAKSCVCRYENFMPKSKSNSITTNNSRLSAKKLLQQQKSANHKNSEKRK